MRSLPFLKLPAVDRHYRHLNDVFATFRSPQLYLYSKADQLISYEEVRGFIEERRQDGVKVTEKCWEDSPHVAHFRMHPEEYGRHVRAFIDENLLR